MDCIGQTACATRGTRLRTGLSALAAALQVVIPAWICAAAAMAGSPPAPIEPDEPLTAVDRVAGGVCCELGDTDGDGLPDALDNCPTPDVTFALFDFQSGAAGWTSLAEAPGVDTWHLADLSCSGAHLGSTVFVSNGNDGPTCVAGSSHESSRLLSPALDLPAGETLRLSFKALSFDEAGACIASGDFDAHDVGITVDGGQSYTTLNNCTDLGDGTGDIRNHSFDVSPYSGMRIQIIFAYDTVDESVGHTFAVDDVAVTRIGVQDPDQTDADSDGVGDLCDNCPTDANADQADVDSEGIGDLCDNCPEISNFDQVDADADGIGDSCDACVDFDRDTFGDPGFPANPCPTDNCPLTPNDQADTDVDGVGNACDNCPSTANAGQQDGDGDTIGDACDNCPSTYNPEQGVVEFGTLVATSRESFSWQTPVDFEYLRGPLDGVRTYAVSAVGAVLNGNSLSIALDATSRYYLVKFSGGCGTWGGVERDAMFP